MRLTICIAAARSLCAGSTPLIATDLPSQAAFQLNETSGRYTDP